MSLNALAGQLWANDTGFWDEVHVRLRQQGLTASPNPYINGGSIPVATYSGAKPVVICNGSVTEVKDLDEAQSKAEQLAHQHQADAYILKPITKVAPKRDVVVTKL